MGKDAAARCGDAFPGWQRKDLVRALKVAGRRQGECLVKQAKSVQARRGRNLSKTGLELVEVVDRNEERSNNIHMERDCLKCFFSF